MTEPCDLPAVDLAAAIARKRVSPVAALGSCLARIAAVDPAVTAFPLVDHDGARRAARDAGCVARLRAADANTRSRVYGATGNAFDPSRSAAGSAVALACGMVPLASGSDTGGSLRSPAAYTLPGEPVRGIPERWTPPPALAPLSR